MDAYAHTFDAVIECPGGAGARELVRRLWNDHVLAWYATFVDADSARLVNDAIDDERSAYYALFVFIAIVARERVVADALRAQIAAGGAGDRERAAFDAWRAFAYAQMCALHTSAFTLDDVDARVRAFVRTVSGQWRARATGFMRAHATGPQEIAARARE